MNDDPAAFLKLPASEEGKLLTEQADQFPGSLVPFWMFAELAIRQRKNSVWIAERGEIERKIKRRAAAGLATLAANLVLLAGYAAHRLEAGGAAEERAVQQERAMQDLRLDIRELRAAMRRMSGDPSSPSGDSRDMFPDRFSLLRGPACTLASPLSFP